MSKNKERRKYIKAIEREKKEQEIDFCFKNLQIHLTNQLSQCHCRNVAKGHPIHVTQCWFTFHTDIFPRFRSLKWSHESQHFSNSVETKTVKSCSSSIPIGSFR